MPSDASGKDPKKIWQSQEREISAVTLERMIRRRAQELHAKTRREQLGSFVGPLAVAGFAWLGISIGYNPVQRAMFAIAGAWSLAGVYVLNRGGWPARLAGEAALATGLEFCRKEIERRLQYHRRFLVWVFAPIVVAIAALVVPAMGNGFKEGGTLAKMTPFLSLVVLWVIGIFVIRRSRWKELQREIDELNDIEKESRL